ncbi:MAG: hypothetical protein IJE93_02435 [Clostridia bacterium]|nr:hypothetical protein [Clostridia bacterium]
MKKYTKIISIVLSVLMVFSVIPFNTTAAAIDETKITSIDSFIETDNIIALVEYLIKNLNAQKENTTGTLLKLLFLSLGNSELTDKAEDAFDDIKDNDDNITSDIEEDVDMSLKAVRALQKTIGKQKVVYNTAAQNSTILVNWLNAILPDLVTEFTEQDWWSTVTSMAKLMGLTIDIDDVDGIMKTLETVNSIVHNKVLGIDADTYGDLEDFNFSAIKGIRTGTDEDNLRLVYSLFQLLADNTAIIGKALKGRLDLGILNDIAGTADLNKSIKDTISKQALLDMIYDLIGLDTERKNSPYAAFTADQLLAVAFLKLVTASDEVVSSEEATALTKLSVYEILGEYGDMIYANLLVEPLNTDVRELLNSLVEDVPEIADYINVNYVFEQDTFSEFFEGKDTDLVAQFNNMVCKLFKVILTKETYKALNLKTGSNKNINKNLEKVCKFILPILAENSENLGFDLSAFTAQAVKDMSLEEMAVAVLKVFFPDWFEQSSKAALNSADTLEELGVLAAYYAMDNWDSVDASVYKKSIFAKNGAMLSKTDSEWLEILLTIGADAAVCALNEASDFTGFSLSPEKVKEYKKTGWGWIEFLDEIVDWAIDFIDGFPVVINNAEITHERGVYDGYGPFYKLNVLTNEFIDFSFLNGVSNETFKLDTEKALIDVCIKNLLNLDVQAVTELVATNSDKDNILSKALIPAVISAANRILTSLFEHSCDETATTTITVDKQKTDVDYCVKNGHYIPEIKYNLGDVDNDGAIKSQDARLALRAAVKLESFEEGSSEFLAADATKDGQIKADDARLILRVAVKLEAFE